MKLYVYNKLNVSEYPISDKNKILAQQELVNRERSADEKTSYIESETFPPVGKFFEIGVGLRDKTEKEKVDSGEISLADLKAKIVDKISALCADEITSGFESNALGEIYVYPSDSTDQSNLVGAVASGEYCRHTRK